MIKHCNSWPRTVGSSYFSFFFEWIETNLNLYSCECTFSLHDSLMILYVFSHFHRVKGIKGGYISWKIFFSSKHIIFVLSFQIKPITHCLLWYLNNLVNVHARKKWERPDKGHLILFCLCSFSLVPVKFVWEAAVRLYGLLHSPAAHACQCFWRETGWTCGIFHVCPRLSFKTHFMCKQLRWAFQVTPRRWITSPLFCIRVKFSGL